MKGRLACRWCKSYDTDQILVQVLHMLLCNLAGDDNAKQPPYKRVGSIHPLAFVLLCLVDRTLSDEQVRGLIKNHMRETFCVAELVVCIFFVKLCALDALFYSVESGYVCADDTIARATGTTLSIGLVLSLRSVGLRRAMF